MYLTSLRRSLAATCAAAAVGFALLTGGQPAAQAAESSQTSASARALDPVNRATIISRAQMWVDQRVPYEDAHYHKWGSHYYFQDCAGYVSWAWGLPRNMGTGELDQVSRLIRKDDLRPGDILLLQPPSPDKHVVIFDHWDDDSHTKLTLYQESTPGSYASKDSDMEYKYFSDLKFEPRRYVQVTD